MWQCFKLKLCIWIKHRQVYLGQHTGWSASNSEPYISTRLAHLSKSEIFFGNQGTLSISGRKDETVTMNPHWWDTVWGAFSYRPRVDRSYLEAPCPPRSHASAAAEWSRSAAHGCCRSPQKCQTQSCVAWIFWTLCVRGWHGFPATNIKTVLVIKMQTYFTNKVETSEY